MVANSDIGEVIDLLERAKAQYKVYMDAACLSQEMFGMGGCVGWLAADAMFDF